MASTKGPPKDTAMFSDDGVKPPARASPPEPISPALPPWHLAGDVYSFTWWNSATEGRSLPEHAYSPLEARATFATSPSSRPAGGLGMIQIIRYHTSPVGPYDEMVLIPGSFDWVRDGQDADGRPYRGRNPRITRIYVSQKHTCYNGRLNWNIPKHLARFDWVIGAGGSVSVKVFPHDTSGDVTESSSSEAPFFQATYTPVRFMPSFPLNSNWAKYAGIDPTLVMPPLPEGEGSQGELPGTQQWCSLHPIQSSRRAEVGWFDIAQRDDKGNATGRYENFWPGLGRWRLGFKMENADLWFDAPVDTWPEPKARL